MREPHIKNKLHVATEFGKLRNSSQLSGTVGHRKSQIHFYTDNVLFFLCVTVGVPQSHTQDFTCFGDCLERKEAFY